MNGLITFVVEFLLISIGFHIGFLVIRNYTTPTFKRFYLLAWMILSIVIPNITIQSSQISPVTINQLVEERAVRPEPKSEFAPMINSPVPQSFEHSGSEVPIESVEAPWSGMDILSMSYLFVTALFLIRILIGLVQIMRLRIRSKTVETNGKTLFEVQDSNFNAASFFNWIFVGPKIDNAVVIEHERIHSALGHSFDILLSHIYCAVFWANPISWILKRYISINTEMEVDSQILKNEESDSYANLLLSISQGLQGSTMMNHFGAFHLKSRIVAITRNIRHQKWVSVFSLFLGLLVFSLFSCEGINSQELMIERMSEVRTITTRFTSHQSDTQQKTGRIVAIASFSPDGTLEELVEQTTYPYDREFEVKKYFWESPETIGVPYIMDGLSLGDAEQTFLYGNDWPSAYYKNLVHRSNSGDGVFKETIITDNEFLPEKIIIKKDHPENAYIDFGLPNITESYEYQDSKVLRVYSMSEYPSLEYDDKRRKNLDNIRDKNQTKKVNEFRKKLIENSGKKELLATYTYDGDLMTSVIWRDKERKFYYENRLLVKSEYIRNGEVINTRLHYYRQSLKDRTEIFNRYNEPEYTITYEYEFW